MPRPNMAHKPSSAARTVSPNRILPYTLLITIGPSVTAATSLFVIVRARPPPLPLISTS